MFLSRNEENCVGDGALEVLGFDLEAVPSHSDWVGAVALSAGAEGIDIRLKPKMDEQEAPGSGLGAHPGRLLRGAMATRAAALPAASTQR